MGRYVAAGAPLVLLGWLGALAGGFTEDAERCLVRVLFLFHRGWAFHAVILTEPVLPS